MSSQQNPCSSDPCLNNATCVAKYKDDDFQCACSPGYIGKLCEKDILKFACFAYNFSISKYAGLFSQGKRIFFRNYGLYDIASSNHREIKATKISGTKFQNSKRTIWAGRGIALPLFCLACFLGLHADDMDNV